jgi:O-antigen ligase
MSPVQKSLFVYSAISFFLIVVVAAVGFQQWWLLVIPVALLFYLWTFEKPAVLLYTLIASIPWSIEYQFSSTLGTDFPDEPLMLLSALTAALLLVYHHKAIWRKQAFHPILKLLLLQMIWVACTVVTSTHPLLSLKFLAAKSWYLFSFVLFPLLLIDTKEKLKAATQILVLSMMVLVLVSLVRHAAAGFSFAAINKSLTPFFRNHVNYSALLVCTIPLLLVFIKRASARWKALFYGLLSIGLAALYFSYARGAWVALAAGVLAYGLLKKKALLLAFYSVVILTISVVFYLQHNDRYLHYAHNYNETIFHTDLAEHLVATYQLKDMSTAERFYRWVAGVRMVEDRWKTGFGPNTFYHNYRSYTVPAFKTWVSANEEHSTVHNYFLLLLIEQGVAGLLLFFMLLAVSFYTTQRLYHSTSDVFWKSTTAAVAVILVMICTVNFLSDLIETDKIGSVFYLCLAVLIIADRAIKRENSQPAPHIQRIA